MYACPACASTYPISRIAKPYTALHHLNIILFGWLGWLDAGSERRMWLRCDSCGHEFRRRTARLAWFVLWLLLLGAGVIGPFVWIFPSSGDPFGGSLLDLFEINPGASVFALLWIIIMLPLGVRLLLRPRLRVASGPSSSTSRFNAPGAGQPFNDA